MIEITDEMLMRGSAAVHDMGGVYFNPMESSDSHTETVRKILAAIFPTANFESGPPD